MPDWTLWLGQYDRPRSPLSHRLLSVRRLIAKHIDRTAPRPVTVVSICAGDGRDILEVLAARDDASRVKATLVELDPRLCAGARARASEIRLTGIDVKQADAGTTATYAGLHPADLVILVGVFGNIADADVRTTVEILPALCKPDALVIWARRNDHEIVESVREWFGAGGFDEVFTSRFNAVFYVGAHRFVGEPRPLPAAQRFFTFRNNGAGGRQRPM